MNTKITVEFSSGETRKFIASDELEEIIMSGKMFSFTTLHPNQGDDIAKMYAGNPMSALGSMMMMKRNAEHLTSDDVTDEQRDIIINVLTSCIKLLSDEITSHDSGLM